MNIIKRVSKKQIHSLVLLIVLAGLLCWTVGVASAQEKDSGVFYAWDSKQFKYQNSNVLVNVNATPDGVWVPFLHHLDFNTDLYAPSSCSAGANTTTQYAGKVWFGLYNTDNMPAGATGFTKTRNWSIVACDRDASSSWDNGDLYLQPATAVTTWDAAKPEHVKVLSQDVVTPCTTGNCQDEIVTTLEITADLDCDGAIDAPIPAGGLCFYAEGFLSSKAATEWKGPLQARFTDAAGDKTVNFDPWLGPTALKLVSLTAHSPVAVSGLVLFSLGMAAAAAMVVSRKAGK